MFNWNKFDTGEIVRFFYATRQSETEFEYHLLSDLFLRAYKSRIFYMPVFFIFVSLMSEEHF